MTCPHCKHGFHYVRKPTRTYKIGYYDAVVRCKNCNGTGKSLPSTTERRLLAVGQN